MKKQITHKYYINKQLFLACLLVLFLWMSACEIKSKSKIGETNIQKIAPISIKGLQQRLYKSEVKFEKNLEDTKTYISKLISYKSDSLKIYALVTTPKLQKLKNGFPILIFGHGFHPEPKKYGVSAKTGKDWRPGDYYRGLPEVFAENGYIVITPDYRGHNVSEGFEFTQTNYLASSYYAIDVLNLISTLNSFENANSEAIFYLGHSMGGDVGLKVLLATNQIKAASIWSGVSASINEQVLYYGKLNDKNNDGTTNSSIKVYMEKLENAVSNLGFEYSIDSGDAIKNLQDLNTPIILHHARWETSVPYQWSESLASKLFEHHKKFELYSYESKNHLLKDENRNIAVQRDLDFFNKITKTTKNQ
jgi:dipeptidyl aminopeptidase/acylaminoacyl peptidase